MMLSRTALLSVLASLLLLTGCGDDSGGRDGSGTRVSPKETSADADRPAADFVMSCRASVTPFVVTYEVEGDTLTLHAPGTVAVGTTTTLRRSGGAGSGMPIIGSWEMPIPPSMQDPAFAKRAELGTRATLIVSHDRIDVLTDCSSKWAKLRAQVTSTIALSESTLRTLETHEEVREWTPTGGEELVRSMAFPLGHEPAPLPKTELAASFPPMPH